MNQTIRKVKLEDISALKEVLDSSELFPSEMLDDMIADYFNKADSEDIWFTTIQERKPISIGYCAPERMTEGTYNLYAIAVRKELQGQGVGAGMMRYIEDQLRESGHRVLLVETSGLPEYALTRKFYDQCNYQREAVVRDFYQEGEDKVIFWKKLISKIQ